MCDKNISFYPTPKYNIIHNTKYINYGNDFLIRLLYSRKCALKNSMYKFVSKIDTYKIAVDLTVFYNLLSLSVTSFTEKIQYIILY